MKSVLIVEDEEQLASLIEKYVTSLGYEVAGVADCGEAALKLIATKRFDLALLDIHIRGSMDGFGLAEVLRRQHDIPSIFLTGQSDEQTLESVLESSAYGYLLKPFRPEELRASMEFALVRHAQERRWRKVEKSFSAAVLSTSDGIIITDAHGKVEFMNPAAERLTGWLARLGKGEAVAHVLPLSSGEDALKKMWAAALNGDSTRAEFEIGRKNDLIRLDVSFTRIEDPAHRAQGVVLVLRDNTELRRSQTELKKTQSQVRNLTERLHGAASNPESETGKS